MDNITVDQLGIAFKLFQDAHPECPHMFLKIDAFMADTGVRPSIRYGYGEGSCYIASYSTSSFSDFYQMMLKDIDKILDIQP